MDISLIATLGDYQRKLATASDGYPPIEVAHAVSVFAPDPTQIAEAICWSNKDGDSAITWTAILVTDRGLVHAHLRRNIATWTVDNPPTAHMADGAADGIASCTRWQNVRMNVRSVKIMDSNTARVTIEILTDDGSIAIPSPPHHNDRENLHRLVTEIVERTS
ncbi:hypothetical protein L5I01_29690 [Gordonia sp. HY442]|uniref:hypothetical protein n=1 Tax=Gordonia zhenghanii TaxID=2911516 RepID=UPI001F3B7D07|nr:hypothetical protein [Gordonia zhenghanii]MCF8607537.1 hypothetical protein [Gordonia zhenghanii]